MMRDRGSSMGRRRGLDQSLGMMLITVAFIFTSWTLAVVVIMVILPHAFHLNTPWPLVALMWVAPILALGGPYLWKRLRY
jgi:hypothetical protein